MASIKFRVLGKNDPVNLNVRFYHNKIDCSTKSNIFISAKDWSSKTNKVKQNADENLKIEIENQLMNLSELIIKKFRVEFPKGISINSEWLNTIVDVYHDKPISGNDPSVYFVDFLSEYIEKSKLRVNPKSGNLISPRTIQNYSTTLLRLSEFEGYTNSRIQIKNVNLNFHSAFVKYLKTVGNYSNTLIEKYISQIKGFVKEAKIAGFETSPEIESRNFSFAREETIATYLNLEEINISENRIRIISSEKTQAAVEIPIHDQVKEMLKRRNNILPKINSQDFNDKIKIICKMAGITESILGNIKDPKTNRKKKDFYPKYKLIASHTCRRSFVSNHYGKIDDKTIMAITTHKSYTQYIKYVRTTLSQHALNLEKAWEADKLKASKI